MLNNILEISETTTKGGRVPVKIALLKIADGDINETNKNGLHWKEEYVKNAMHSVKMMPICTAFCDDDRTVPLDHGYTGVFINDEGLEEPEFENSEVVGCFESASIENVEVNGETIKALVGTGYFYIQRYPSFVSWVRKNYALSTVDTSIEIVGLPSNNNKIIYEEDEPTEKYRTPKEFLFSASCVLSVQPADSHAIILEVAQKKNKKEEEETMDMNEVKSVIQSTISELNDKSQNYETKIAELNTQIEEKNAEIEEKNNTISELNASIEKIQAALDKLNKDCETYWAEREILERELAKAKVAEKLGELNSALGEFNDEEKEIAKDDIEKLTTEINSAEKKETLDNVTSEINSIKSKICMNIVAKQKQAEAESQRVSELNSKNSEHDVDDIFSEICTENKQDDDEDLNIF